MVQLAEGIVFIVKVAIFFAIILPAVYYGIIFAISIVDDKKSQKKNEIHIPRFK